MFYFFSLEQPVFKASSVLEVHFIEKGRFKNRNVGEGRPRRDLLEHLERLFQRRLRFFEASLQMWKGLFPEESGMLQSPRRSCKSWNTLRSVCSHVTLVLFEFAVVREECFKTRELFADHQLKIFNKK